MSFPHFPFANDGPDAARADIGSRKGGPDLPEPCRAQAPLVDHDVLRELEEDFDGPTVVHDFARDFAQSWAAKYRRLSRFVEQRDRPRAKEAALSVKVTSTMVGAVRLALLAAWFEQLIEDDKMDAVAQKLACVEKCGLETRMELLETYIPRDLP